MSYKSVIKGWRAAVINNIRLILESKGRPMDCSRPTHSRPIVRNYEGVGCSNIGYWSMNLNW